MGTISTNIKELIGSAKAHSLRASTLTCVVIVISGYLAVDPRHVSAALHDSDFDCGGIPRSVSGLWREAERHDTYIHIVCGFIGIYRRNELSPGDDTTSDEDCYLDGGTSLLSRIESDRYLMDPLSRPPRSRTIDLIVRDDPDVMWVVLERSFLGDNEVQYIREHELWMGELPICD